MGSGALWTIIGSVTGLVALGLTAWQVRLQILEHRHARVARHVVGVPEPAGLPVAAPLGGLPVEVRGRDALLAELRQPLGRGRLTRWPRRPGPRAWVLAGMGGLGKSTVALATARAARAKGWRVWWVTATDSASLAGGMLEVLRQLCQRAHAGRQKVLGDDHPDTVAARHTLAELTLETRPKPLPPTSAVQS